MLEVLRHPQFRRLFTAQLVALVGTGLATVALALLAYDLAGPSAGAVLGTALAIKMVVYVLLSPLSGAMVPLNLRKPVLVALDLVRAAVALTLPFVTEIWQVYVLIALLKSASACFTPLFQALIPEILKEERDYTRALSLSRLAYDLESLLSPALAAALLTLVSFHGLFAGTSIGFVLSAVLGLAMAAVHAVALASAWAYNAGLKKSAWSIAPFIVSFGLFPSLATLAADPPRLATPWATLAGAALGAAVHLTNVLPDLEDDDRTGIRGLPHRLGARVSVIVAIAGIAVGAIAVLVGPVGGDLGRIGPVAWLFFAAVGAVAVVTLVRALRHPPGRALFRLTMLCALLLAAQLVATGGS